MTATVRDLIIVLETFLLGSLSMEHGLYILVMVASLYPLLRLHLHQQTEPHQPRETAWLKSILFLLARAFRSEDQAAEAWLDDGIAMEYAQDLCRDLDVLYEYLGLDSSDHTKSFFPKPPALLCTSRIDCVICPPGNGHRTLRRRTKVQTIWILDATFTWHNADLFIAQCPSCRADYYPDRVLYKGLDNSRCQKLECDANYLRVSKHGIWVHRKIAIAQEKALCRFHAGWSNFADWLNDTIGGKIRMTYHQTQRLYLEHFTRCLLVTHGKQNFASPANPSSRALAESIRGEIGCDGGILASAMHHGCMDCTHHKRYRVDLINEGVELNEAIDNVAELAVEGEAEVCSSHICGTIYERTTQNVPADINLPPEYLVQPAQQEAPPDGQHRGYVRMAVMDGKTITHRVGNSHVIPNPNTDLLNRFVPSTNATSPCITIGMVGSVKNIFSFGISVA